MALRIFLWSVALVAWFGFVGPFCMSSSSDILCIAWPLCTFGGALWFISKTVTKLTKGEKK